MASESSRHSAQSIQEELACREFIAVDYQQLQPHHAEQKDTGQ